MDWSALVIALAVGSLIGHFWPKSERSDPADTDTEPPQDLREAISALQEEQERLSQRLDALVSTESLREANTVDALDKFTRLYKRMAERQSREDAPQSTNGFEEGGESPLDLRRRMRGQ